MTIDQNKIATAFKNFPESYFSTRASPRATKKLLAADASAAVKRWFRSFTHHIATNYPELSHFSGGYGGNNKYGIVKIGRQRSRNLKLDSHDAIYAEMSDDNSDDISIIVELGDDEKAKVSIDPAADTDIETVLNRALMRADGNPFQTIREFLIHINYEAERCRFGDAFLPFDSPIHSKGEETGNPPRGGEPPEHTPTSTRNAIARSVILFGPPGTGKTFATTACALAPFANVPPREWNEECGEVAKRVLDSVLDGRFDIGDEDIPASAKMYARLEAAGNIRFVTFHQSYTYEDFVEGIRASVSDAGGIQYATVPGVFKSLVIDALSSWLAAHGIEVPTNNVLEKTAEVVRGVTTPAVQSGDEKRPMPYVLIIDEINRGNVAKIFGELITLIEDSKRTTPLNSRRPGNQPTGVRLPLSGDTLYLPPNLYIIGTMNTADRSLIGMDMAMRRRFSFIELLPRPDLLDVEIEHENCQLSLYEFLTELNNRIDAHDTPDHAIGHAYLMGVNDFAGLQDRMRNKIIPQLRENLIGNPETLQRILAADIEKPRETSLVNEHGRPIQRRLENLLNYMTSRQAAG